MITPCTNMRQQQKRGFTLLELIMTIIIISILVTVAAPMLRLGTEVKVDSIGARIVTMLNYCQNQAVVLNKPVTVTIDGTNGKMTLVQTDGVKPLPTEPSSYVFNISSDYQATVTLDCVDLPASQITFMPNGSAVDNTEALLGDSNKITASIGEYSISISVNPISGVATTLSE